METISISTAFILHSCLAQNLSIMQEASCTVLIVGYLRISTLRGCLSRCATECQETAKGKIDESEDNDLPRPPLCTAIFFTFYFFPQRLTQKIFSL